MGRFRQSSVSRRVAISVIALYALLLQGFLVAATQAAAFDSFGDVTCSPAEPNSTSTGGEQQDHRHGLCCILACAASGCAYLATASGVAVFPERVATAIVWTSGSGFTSRSPQRFFFAARGPPQIL